MKKDSTGREGEKEYADRCGFAQLWAPNIHLVRHLLDGMAYPEYQSPVSRQTYPDNKGDQ